MKVYICLFTCAVSRVVHLELVEILNVADFILSFRRFSGMRGFPGLIVFDNAKAFVAANSFLRNLMVSEEAKEYFDNRNIE